MTDRTVPQPADTADRDKPAEGFALVASLRRSSIMPQSTVASRTLTMVMAVMCYLACLALGSLIIITKSVNAWTSGISSQITIQIKPIDGRPIDNEIRKALGVLRATPGITDAVAMTDQDAARLLEPWLGKGNILAELPVPRMIAVGIDRHDPPDLTALATRLGNEVAGVSLDTHRQWQSQLTRTAGTLELIGVGVLLLISATAVAIVIFATRSALASNHEVVEVLHLVGAYDSFIAIQVQWHFLKLGLKAGVIGGLAGAGTFVLIGLFAGGTLPAGLAQNAASLVSNPVNLTIANYLLFLLVPAVTTLITVFSARAAVLRILSNIL